MSWTLYGVPELVYYVSSGANYQADTNGQVTNVTDGDLADLVRQGLAVVPFVQAVPVVLPDTAVTPGSYSHANITVDQKGRLTAAAGGTHSSLTQLSTPTAPAAGTAGRIVASVALTNTSLTIANNPDAMRKCQVRVDPGSTAITAGICTVTYAANDGTAAQADALSLVTAASTLLTVPFTKGVLTVASAVVTGLVGGASPKIQIDTTADLAVPVPPGASGVTILKEVTDGSDSSGNLGTLTNAGIWTPHTAPNATHTYTLAYTSIAP